MKEDNLSVLGNQPETLENIQGEVISFNIEAAEQKIPFSINIMADEATLADIVAPARKLSSKIAIAHREMTLKNGQTIPCKKGCCSCCSTIIPMSIPEAFRLREEFAEMETEKSKRLLEDCIETAKLILETAQQDQIVENLESTDKAKITEVNQWYSKLETTCPFLSKRGLCKIYEQRPLACREHIVTGTPKYCSKDCECKPNVVPMQVSVLEALGQLSSELENTEVEAIMLPFSVAWAIDNTNRGQKKWPAIKMVRRFAEILQKRCSISVEAAEKNKLHHTQPSD